MSSHDPTLQGKLIWSGEHWINFLRPTGADTDSAQLSLYHSSYSPAGEGNVAFVIIPGILEAVCTDNRDLVEFIIETMIRGKNASLDRELAVFDATFRRGGNVCQSPSWRIELPGHLLEASWSQLHQPVMIYRSDRKIQRRRPVFTLLFFAEDAEIRWDGVSFPGSPYRRDIWREAIGGGARSSCVFALAETMIQPQPNQVSLEPMIASPE